MVYTPTGRFYELTGDELAVDPTHRGWSTLAARGRELGVIEGLDAHSAARYGFTDPAAAVRHPHLADSDGFIPSARGVRISRPRDRKTYARVFRAIHGCSPMDAWNARFPGLLRITDRDGTLSCVPRWDATPGELREALDQSLQILDDGGQITPPPPETAGAWRDETPAERIGCIREHPRGARNPAYNKNADRAAGYHQSHLERSHHHTRMHAVARDPAERDAHATAAHLYRVASEHYGWARDLFTTGRDDAGHAAMREADRHRLKAVGHACRHGIIPPEVRRGPEKRQRSSMRVPTDRARYR
jgi:hypothetical protein